MCDTAKCHDFQYIQCIKYNETTFKQIHNITYDKIICDDISLKHIIATILSLIFCIRYCICLAIAIARDVKHDVARIFANFILFSIWLVNLIRSTSNNYALRFVGNSSNKTRAKYKSITQELFIYPVIWLCIVISYHSHRLIKYYKNKNKNKNKHPISESNHSRQDSTIHGSNSSKIVSYQSSEKVVV